MNADRWQRITAIFTEALDYPATERESFLKQACAGDVALKQAVERLLENDDAAADDRFLNPVSFATTESALSSEGAGTVEDAPPPDGHFVRLTVIDGPLKGEWWVFRDRQTWVVGRAADAQLSVPENRRLSRYHCRFDISPPRCRVLDLGSTNGTCVNGQRIQESALRAGDIVTAGDVQIEISISTGPPSDVSSGADHSVENTLTADMEFIPEEIAGYRVLRELGRGSMGTVYLGRHSESGRRAAIKVVRPVTLQDESAPRRFLREASVLAKLSHPRIVTSYQFGIMPCGVEEAPYLITEYIREVDLDRILQALPFAERLRVGVGVICRILEALQYAHEQGVVHRDVKPSNFLPYREHGKLQVKLSDFGMAKSYVAAGLSGFTGSDQFCGTLAYASPEQLLDCRHARPQCDIYAAGVCLYEMLAGRYHYDFEDALSAVGMILNTDPYPIHEHCPEVPDSLAALIDGALRRDPGERFASAEEFAKALQPFAARR